MLTAEEAMQKVRGTDGEGKMEGGGRGQGCGAEQEAKGWAIIGVDGGWGSPGGVLSH